MSATNTNTARLEVRIPERINALVQREARLAGVSKAVIVRWVLAAHYGLATPSARPRIPRLADDP